MNKHYSSPRTKTIPSKIRTSILAGSVDTGVFNGVSGGTISGKDFTFEVKRSKTIINID